MKEEEVRVLFCQFVVEECISVDQTNRKRLPLLAPLLTPLSFQMNKPLTFSQFFFLNSTDQQGSP